MNDTSREMTYAGSGVNYETMDPFKRAAQEAAARTAHNADRLGVAPMETTRGESAYSFVASAAAVFSHVEEGLGTKNLVADEMYKLTTMAQYFWGISQDTVAMIVNDMATLGISPITCAMHLAVGDSKWFDDKRRAQALIHGWKRACDMAGCIWSGGETPTLKGIIAPETFVLSGSAVGKCRYHPIDPERISGGDSIVFLTSSGIHANGLTLAREIAAKLPKGYLTEISESGPMYGHALLEPTHIYCRFVEECLAAGIDIHYAVNITGHGWRKLMRARRELTYVIEHIPEVPPVLEFMQKHGPVNDREAFGNLNMGAGFALYVPHGEEKKVIRLAKKKRGVERIWPFDAMYAGYIKRGERKVWIKPKGIIFGAETLGVR